MRTSFSAVQVAEQRFEEVGRLRQDFDPHVGVGFQAGELLGFDDGVVQRAQLIDQAVSLAWRPV